MSLSLSPLASSLTCAVVWLVSVFCFVSAIELDVAAYGLGVVECSVEENFKSREVDAVAGTTLSFVVSCTLLSESVSAGDAVCSALRSKSYVNLHVRSVFCGSNT